MRGLKIHFAKKGGRILTDESVSDFAATCQKALVNIGTARGSHEFFPKKGTDLFKNCTAGNLLDRNRLNHFCNFAALDTVVFIKTNDTYTTNGLKKMTLTPDANITNTAKVAFVADDGTVIGLTTSL